MKKKKQEGKKINARFERDINKENKLNHIILRVFYMFDLAFAQINWLSSN